MMSYNRGIENTMKFMKKKNNYAQEALRKC